MSLGLHKKKSTSTFQTWTLELKFLCLLKHKVHGLYLVSWYSKSVTSRVQIPKLTLNYMATELIPL